MTNFFLKTFKLKYRYLIRPILFQFDSESVHNFTTKAGVFAGKCKITKSILKTFWGKKHKKLKKEILGITFESPIGLSAGFDYNGELTQILPSLGFGFATIGTVTNRPYDGNPEPRLGRLIKTKALLVNKGFKSAGIDEVLKSLKGKQFDIPIGISIGKTNIPEINTQELAINDILESFRKTEESKVPFSYYELNISCPNLFGDVSFYPSPNLRALLREINHLNLNKPLFIKMPIEKSNAEVIEMLNVIKDFKVDGVIFGNLQKDRNHPSIIQEEISKYPKGYPSGFPTRERSTELIKLTNTAFPNRFVIIGCGGVFNTKDAKEKLDAGASLIQMITGLVYEGPQVVAKINYDLNRIS